MPYWLWLHLSFSQKLDYSIDLEGSAAGLAVAVAFVAVVAAAAAVRKAFAGSGSLAGADNPVGVGMTAVAVSARMPSGVAAARYSGPRIALGRPVARWGVARELEVQPVEARCPHRSHLRPRYRDRLVRLYDAYALRPVSAIHVRELLGG